MYKFRRTCCCCCVNMRCILCMSDQNCVFRVRQSALDKKQVYLQAQIPMVWICGVVECLAYCRCCCRMDYRQDDRFRDRYPHQLQCHSAFAERKKNEYFNLVRQKLWFYTVNTYSRKRLDFMNFSWIFFEVLDVLLSKFLKDDVITIAFNCLPVVNLFETEFKPKI